MAQRNVRWIKGGAIPRLLVLAFCAVMSQMAMAATLCVNPSGSSGCFSTIGAAVAAASAYDTIRVAPGTYNEDVIVDKPLSLIGHNRDNTIIDATGLSNGIYIDGIDNPGLRDVVVAGFTVEDANFEGILVTNSAVVTIVDNLVTKNEQSLPSGCPGIPSFETEEPPFDCGQGIHLTGVRHSTVANNDVVKNVGGGILLSDETGPTHDNLITGNRAKDNPLDCGIVLASHPPATLTGSSVPLGVFQNTISDNESSHNGFQPPGEGAGVGLFSDQPGGMVVGNVVIDNELRNNGIPGVALHAHMVTSGTPPDLSNNVIVRNRISGNGPDLGDTPTPGPTGILIFSYSPIKGVLISQNVITDETDDIVVHTPPGFEVAAQLNDLLGHKTGVFNSDTPGPPNGPGPTGTGVINAIENWWGCAAGPGAPGCAKVGGPNVRFKPWLNKPFRPNEE